MLTANVIAVLEDESFQAEVDAERATLRAAADAPTDLQAHEPSDSPAPATPRSSPATAVHKGRVRYPLRVVCELLAGRGGVFSRLVECVWDRAVIAVKFVHFLLWNS